MLPFSLKSKITFPSEFVISRLINQSIKLRRETPSGSAITPKSIVPRPIHTGFTLIADNPTSTSNDPLGSFNLRKVKPRGKEEQQMQDLASSRISTFSTLPKVLDIKTF